MLLEREEAVVDIVIEGGIEKKPYAQKEEALVDNRVQCNVEMVKNV